MITKKAAKVEENKKQESFNIDSLLNAYKEEANKKDTTEAENRKADKEHSQHSNPTKESQWKALPTIKLPEGSRVLDDNNIAVKHDTPHLKRIYWREKCAELTLETSQEI